MSTFKMYCLLKLDDWAGFNLFMSIFSGMLIFL
jgi:hypothetical protein